MAETVRYERRVMSVFYKKSIRNGNPHFHIVLMNVEQKFRPGHSYLHRIQALLRLVEVAVMPQEEAARASLRVRQSIPLGGGGSRGGTEDKQWAGRRLVMSSLCNELPCPSCFHLRVREEKEHVRFVQGNDCGQGIGNSQADSAGVCRAE